MNRAIAIAHFCMYIAITLLALSCTFFVLQGREGLITTVTKLDLALDKINAPCTDNGHQYVCGTLANVDQTTRNVGILAAQGAQQAKLNGQLFQTTTQGINTAMLTVNTRLPGLFDRTDASLANIDTATAKIPPLVDAATDRINGLKPLEDNLATLAADTDERTGTTFAQLKVTIDDINARLADPNITKLIVESTGIATNLNATTADFQAKFHAYLYPEPCKTFWCKLARLWPYIKDAASLGEALYWTHALFAGVKP